MTDPTPAPDPGAGEPPAAAVPPVEPEAPAPPPRCAACARPLRADAAFCSHCGHRVGDPPPAPRRARERFTMLRRRIEGQWTSVKFVISFYVALLFVQIGSAVAFRLADKDVTAMLVGDGLFAGATVAAAVARREVLRGAYGAGARFAGSIGLSLLGAVPLYAAVHFFVAGLSWAFHTTSPRMLDDFAGLHWAWPVALICVTPAVFEELAFRGLVFGVLAKHTRLIEALLVSSVAFAILHLNVMALFSHTAMGLWFCWLRWRSGSLWPGMLAHFLHNFLVLADEHLGILPG